MKSTTRWPLCGAWLIMQCISHYQKESLCHGWHCISCHECYYGRWLITTFARAFQHEFSAYTIPTQALGWESSQNIETVNQLKNLGSLGHKEENEEENEVECLEIVMKLYIPWSVVTKLPVQSCWDPAGLENRSFQVGPARPPCE